MVNASVQQPETSADSSLGSSAGTDASKSLFARATRCIPGGVNSPVRAMRSVDRDHPLFIDRGAGSRIWDADGNRYIDWVQSWGALPFGHAFPPVVEAVALAVRAGSSFGAPTRAEIELAELIVDAVPGIEQVRFTSSGTEATMSALRLARAATGRDTIITFAGNYHGHADSFLATGGSGLATLSIPASPGVPRATAELALQATYGDLDSVSQLLTDSASGGRPVAAVFVEPVAANMGVIEGGRDFLAGLRRLCDEHGALLVFDEVITGFRVAWGGAQQLYGVRADLVCFGKVIGGGLPVGAWAGPRALMELIAPVGTVYQAGTLSGNPLAMRAGIAQLTALAEPGTYERLAERGTRLAGALEAAVAATGAHAAVTRVGSLVTLFHLGAAQHAAPSTFDEARELDVDAFARTHAVALARGHYLPPSQYEALFASTTHDDDMIDELEAAVTRALQPTGDRTP